MPDGIHHAQIILGIDIPLLRSLKRFLKIRHIIRPHRLVQAQGNQGGCKPFDCLFHVFSPISVWGGFSAAVNDRTGQIAAAGLLRVQMPSERCSDGIGSADFEGTQAD